MKRRQAHVSRAQRRDRDKQAEEVKQAIDAIARAARQRRKGDLRKKPGK